MPLSTFNTDLQMQLLPPIIILVLALLHPPFHITSLQWHYLQQVIGPFRAIINLLPPHIGHILPSHVPSIGIEFYPNSFVGLLKNHAHKGLPPSLSDHLMELRVGDEFSEVKPSLWDHSKATDVLETVGQHYYKTGG
jgi:hypothetical protein